jgi:PAS domain S-box-containing protein
MMSKLDSAIARFFREADTNYKTLVEMATDAIIAFDQEGRILLWNSAAGRIFGYSQAKAVGASVTGLIVPDPEVERWQQELKDLSGSRESLAGRVIEREMKRKDGQKFPAELSISTRPSAEGRVSIAIIRDITERRQVEETLRASERQLRLVTDALPALISYVDSNKCYRFNNRAYEEWFGHPRAEVHGRHMEQVLGPAAYQTIAHHVEAALAGQAVTYEAEVPYKDGGNRFIQASYIPDIAADGQVKGFFALISDMTERRRAEEALRLSEERFAKAFRASPDVLIISRQVDGQILEVNDSWEELFGYSRDEVIGRSSLELNLFVNPADRQQLIHQLQQAGSVRDYELEIRRKTGEVRQASLSTEMIVIHDESCLLTILRDITERRLAMAEINSVARFPGENPNPVLRFARDGVLLYANPASRPLLAVWKSEVGGRAPEDVQRLVTASLATGANREVEVTSGETVYSLIFTPIVEADYVNVYGRDMTERKRAEEALRQSEFRLQTALQEKEVLLKEIHHRVKNNLQAIFNLLYLQAGQLQDQQTRQMFQDTQARVKSIALVHEKLYQTEDLSQVNLAEYLHSLAQYLLHAYGVDPERIVLHMAINTVSLDLDTAIPLGIIVNELVSNALKYAFPDHRPGEIRIELQADQGQLCLTVSDNGVGFPEELDPATASTLGLQLVNMLTGHLHGQMTLRRDKGATFQIRFTPLWPGSGSI